MLPLGVSMLWEAADPGRALRERFGFADLPTASAWLGTVLHEHWGIRRGICSRLVISDDNVIAWADSDRGALVVKWSRARDRFETLRASTELLGRLAERGIPVAEPIRAVDGSARVVIERPAVPLSLAVLPELQGTWLDVQDRVAVRAAGACLARVHQALAECSDDQPVFPADDEDPRPRMEHWLEHRDPGFAPEASRRLRDMLALLPDLDEQPQLVHGDFRAANILTHGSAIAGVLDFDEVAVRHRLRDLAQASIYLGTRFTDWRPTPAAARQDLRAGYESVRPLEPGERAWCDALTLWMGIGAIAGQDDRAGWAAAL